MKIVVAEATVHLPGGLAPGGVYRVDADAEYVRDCFKAGYLVMVDSLGDDVRHWYVAVNGPGGGGNATQPHPGGVRAVTFVPEDETAVAARVDEILDA